jgi:tetratricopeptide (TPR) repeat protein
LNEAVCYLKLNEPLEAIKQCALALKQDSNSVKALYRRATVGPVLCIQLNAIVFVHTQAYHMIKDYALAIEDLDKLLKLEPTNTAASVKRAECDHAMKMETKRESDLYKKMFNSPPPVAIPKTSSTIESDGKLEPTTSTQGV